MAMVDAPPHSTASEAELIAACRAGEQTAWETLIQRYQRLVYAIPRRLSQFTAMVPYVVTLIALFLTQARRRKTALA